jgi:hypothetical protein
VLSDFDWDGIEKFLGESVAVGLDLLFSEAFRRDAFRRWLDFRHKNLLVRKM